MEEVPNTMYQLFTAYSAVWGLIVLYLISLGVRLSRLEQKDKNVG